ncbi:MAG: DUF4112 domain-containing protein, partial [Candidatus Binatia bacterium]
DLLDRRFTIPGTAIRFGLDPVLGLIPGIGDTIANLTGSAILLIAARYGLPKIVLMRMAVNIAVNTIIGAIPVFGDIFSIWFRSNVKNVHLLERYAVTEDSQAETGDWIFVAALIGGLLLLLGGIIAAIVWLLKALINAI